jgi:hypothetical protein
MLPSSSNYDGIYFNFLSDDVLEGFPPPPSSLELHVGIITSSDTTVISLTQIINSSYVKMILKPYNNFLSNEYYQTHGKQT